jgi:hypothetical protein
VTIVNRIILIGAIFLIIVFICALLLSPRDLLGRNCSLFFYNGQGEEVGKIKIRSTTDELKNPKYIFDVFSNGPWLSKVNKVKFNKPLEYFFKGRFRDWYMMTKNGIALEMFVYAESSDFRPVEIWINFDPHGRMIWGSSVSRNDIDGDAHGLGRIYCSGNLSYGVIEK